jgi:hypothetical protein
MISRHIYAKVSKNLMANTLAINGKIISYNFATRDAPLDSKEKIEIVRK